MAESASKQIISYRELQRKWNDLGDDLKARERFVKDNQTAFHNLGFAVSGVTEAESILVQNTDAVVNAIMARAKAAAYQELATEELKRQIEADQKNDLTKVGRVESGKTRLRYKSGMKLSIEEKKEVRERYGWRANLGDAEGVINEREASALNKASQAYQKQQQAKTKALKEESEKRIEYYQNELKKSLDSQRDAAMQAGAKLYNGEKDRPKEDAANSRKIEEQTKAGQKMAELLDKQKREQARHAELVQFSTREAEIKAMQDGTDKTIRQLELDRDKELAAIRHSYEDLKVARIEEAKKLWEADPKNNGRNFYESTKFKNTNWDSTYTTEEKENRNAHENAVFKYYMDGINAEEKANREAINSYLKQYGDYSQKKQAIYDDANAEICELEEQLSHTTTEEARQAVEAKINIIKEGTKKQIEDLDVQYGKAKAFMIDLFEDASKKSIKSIDHIIKKYEALMKFLKGDGKGKVNRKDLLDLGFSEKEMDNAVKSIDTQGVEAIDKLRERIAALKGELGNRSPWIQFKNNLNDAFKNLSKKTAENPEGGQFGLGLETIGTNIQEITPELDNLAEGIGKCFNVDTSSLQNASKILQEFGGIVNGLGQIAQKNYVGGAISIIGSLGSIISELTDNSSSILVSLNSNIERNNENLSRLADALEKSYGIAAQELALRERELVSRKQDTLVEALLASGLTEAHIGNGRLAKRTPDLLNLGLDFGDEDETFLVLLDLV